MAATLNVVSQEQELTSAALEVVVACSQPCRCAQPCVSEQPAVPCVESSRAWNRGPDVDKLVALGLEMMVRKAALKYAQAGAKDGL